VELKRAVPDKVLDRGHDFLDGFAQVESAAAFRRLIDRGLLDTTYEFGGSREITLNKFAHLQAIGVEAFQLAAFEHGIVHLLAEAR